jgi:hypothetical protein
MGYQISQYNLVHSGHQPDQKLYAYRTLPEDIIQLINQMYISGATPSVIKRFLFITKQPELTTDQIHRIVKSPQIECFGSQSQELVSYMKSIGGDYMVYDETLNDKVHRMAVLTFTPNELSNFQNYCDMIFMDATCVPLQLEWQLIPLPLIGPNKTIHCGGILFTALVTIDIIYWLIKSLNSIEP